MELGLAWLRIEVRLRWRSLLVLTLLVALSAGTVLTAVAGARRGAGALDRLVDLTLPATAVAHTNQDGFDNWAPVRELPEVAALTTYAAYSGFSIDEAPSDPVRRYIPIDPQAMRTVERPVVLAGRLTNPTRADEVVVTQGFVDTYDRGVGDTLTMRLFSAKQFDTGVNAVRGTTWPQPEGPSFPVRIVGVVRSPWYRDLVGEPGRVYPSPGLASRYPTSVLGAGLTGERWALVRLRHGDADLATFRANFTAIAAATIDKANGTSAEVEPTAAALQHSRHVARFEALSLLVLALVALLAAVGMLGQTIVRYVSFVVSDLTVLRALGLTPRNGTVVATLGPGLAALTGAGLGFGGAIAASRWMPFGAAATLEPSPGVDVDWLVLGVGAVVTILLTVGGAAGAAWLALSGERSRPRVRSSVIVEAARRTGLPAPVVVGTRFALETSREQGAAPTRSALIGAVIGVTGILAAATFAAGVADAADHPARFGQSNQLEIGFGYNGHDLTWDFSKVRASTVLDALRQDMDVVGVMDSPFSVAEIADRGVVAFTYRIDQDSGQVVLTEGDLPRLPGDAVLAPTLARKLGVHVGSTVPMSTNGTSVSLRVSGIGFVPQTSYNDYDSGVWILPSDYAELFDTGFINHPGLVKLRPGAQAATVIPRLERAVAGTGAAPLSTFMSRPELPRRLWEIRDIQALPLLLGGFLAMLAMVAVGHSLETSVRRRQRDIAVLRAMGMTRPQTRLLVATQASVLALIGLVFGVPLGIALGRVVWRVVADSTPLAYQPPMAMWALLLVVPAAVLVANALAGPAGRRCARLRIADALRVE